MSAVIQGRSATTVPTPRDAATTTTEAAPRGDQAVQSGTSPPTKVCAHCRLELPRSAFFASASRADGLQATCRSCKNEQRRAKPPPANDDPFLNFDRLPGVALVTLPTLRRLLSCSRSTIESRISSGDLPAPARDGNRRVWTAKAIREHLQRVAA